MTGNDERDGRPTEREASTPADEAPGAGGERPEPPEAHREGVPLVGQVVEKTAVVVQKTTRFSREVVATMISLASAAFGVVAALAWNTAITRAFARAFGQDSAPTLALLFVYAVVVTVVGVVVIVLLGRLAARISAEPVKFKYPAAPKS